MRDFADLAYVIGCLIWPLAWWFGRQNRHSVSWRHFSRGFLLMAIVSIMLLFMGFAEPYSDLRQFVVRVVSPCFYLAALLSFVAGAASTGHAGGSSAASWADTVSRYYATDEMMSRAAASAAPTANDDLEQLREQWHAAFSQLLVPDPERTGLWGNERSSRVLILERYVEMPSYEGSACGQVRSVHFTIHGPGDVERWMSASVTYAVDQVVVGKFFVKNKDVLKQAQQPSGLYEFERIRHFLATGEIHERLEDWLAMPLLRFGKALVLSPANVALAFAGACYAPVKNFMEKRQRRSRFVLTRRPELLPTEQSGQPVGYWNALLPELSIERESVLRTILSELASRAEFGIKTYSKDVIQWGGFSVKEVRQQTVIELRRAKVYVGIYSYGKDLYVRWDGHINRRTWMLHKFPYAAGLGYRFEERLFGWAAPLFVRVPDVFEYSPTESRVTDYDWADVDALQDLAHEILTNKVRELKERHKIEKEIDFEMKAGARQDHVEPEAAEGKRKAGWGRAFARQQ